MGNRASLTRRRLLRAGGGLAAGVPLATGRAAADGASAGPPPEAYQPTASKNWWYFNGHLYDGGDPSRPAFDVSGAFVADHGGDAVGHLMLFTLVEYESDRRHAHAVEGTVRPSMERYAAAFRGHDAGGRVRRVVDGDGRDRPSRWVASLDAPGDTRVDLTFTSTYDQKLRTGYPEGTGEGNVIFWNRARVGGTVSTADGTREVAGVGFLEHVWGTWSRATQGGIDFANVHLARGRGRSAGGNPCRGAGEASLYFRRTFYQGAPGTGPVDGDVGPVLFATWDGRTWYRATDLDCRYVVDGREVHCREHRAGTPEAVTLDARLEGDGRVVARLDRLPAATIEIPESEPLGRIHEGSAAVEGRVRPPAGERDGAGGSRPVSGVAQVEHQRFAPQYPY